MYKILTLNGISKKGLSKLPRDDYQIGEDIKDPDGIMVRSYGMHDMKLPESVLAIARAGAGVNNIPVEKCSEQGIVVFNTPGANANAVKELVIACMLLGSRKLVDSIEWTKTLKGKDNIAELVEEGKKAFVGPEIKGKKIGVIGLGAVGVMVANIAVNLGMEVLGYDPYLSVDAAWSLSSAVHRAENLESVVSQCDYVTMHIPLNDSTKNMFNKNLFAITKKGAMLLNLARGELVNYDDLKAAIDEGIISKYITDFISDEILGYKNVIITPHIGASTPESEENCAEMAAGELRNYIENGNIINSVNFPYCEMPYYGKSRVAILHKNVPNMIGSITSTFAADNINIDNMVNKSRGKWAYTLIDADGLNKMGDKIIAHLKSIEGVVGARIVRER